MMNKDRDKRSVPIFYRKTGETRMSEPVPVNASRNARDERHSRPEVLMPQSAEPEAAAGTTPLPSASDPTMAERTAEQSGATPSTPGPAPASPQTNSGSAVQASAPPNGTPPGKRPKGGIQTLEQFIQYAYGRKGQRVTLKRSVEKQIAQSSHLDEAAMGRLLQLANGDALLAVPRQLLLLSREIVGFPGLRMALTSFVSNVMLRHTAFEDVDVQAALRNLPEGPTAADALARVIAFTPTSGTATRPLKTGDLQALRRNAAQLFVTWLVVSRGLNAEELSVLLFQVVWLPAARELPDDNARLRVLTDFENAAGVGLACQQLRQQAIEARTRLDQAQRDAASLREKLAASEAALAAAVEQRDALQAGLRALQTSSAAQIESLSRQHTLDKAHLRHAHDQLRGRLVKRLTDSAEMLDVGLAAIRRDPPRVPVMVERAEYVVDVLRVEIQSLSRSDV